MVLVRRAPRWMRCCGLEWLFRLAIEPRRLWRRHLFNNPHYLWPLAGMALSRKAGP
jgi:N-acetylglucosaminyldiphosphoundecaprenol N-acetyl-beta-D-mannosaminyltransferase